MPDAGSIADSSMSPTNVELVVSHGGQSRVVRVDEQQTIAELQDELCTLFHVDPSHQKVLLPKGRRLALDQPMLTVIQALRETITSAFTTTTRQPPLTIKVMLLGPKLSVVEQMQNVERERDLKKRAFEHHSRHKPVVASTLTNRIRTIGSEDEEQFKFHLIKAFGKEVECFEERKAMLKRLSEDEAVRDVMKRHRFVVGTLTELHPLLQPTLLGLNRNAGEEICLRLLTDDLTGTRSYLDVRKVLLHELSHNKFGPHDDDFKTLNSLLNRQVAEFESKHGMRTTSGPLQPWEPSGAESGLRPRGGRTLQDADEAQDKRQALEWSEEEWFEMKRERMRMAAEKRLREQQSRQQ
ncbi:hypothetical protein ACM66B_003681 [Microbotryomycetes sp. NB124-2]